MTTPAAPQALIVGANPTRLWGMSASERLRRGLLRIGATRVVSEPAELPEQGRVLLVSSHWVFDEPLLASLARSPNVVLLEGSSGRVVAAHVEAAEAGLVAAVIDAGSGPEALAESIQRRDVAGLAGTYNDELRKRELPYLLRLTPETRAAVERRMFMGSYKGVTDVVTKYLWPRPAEVVTRWCSQLGISPNQVTFAGLLLVFLSFWAFWQGHYGLGLASGWVMTFLDTVDGKLARCTLTSSPIGNVFDHGIDLIHPPFWWWAWVVGLTAYGTPMSPALTTTVLAVILGGYVLQRVLEGMFIRYLGMDMHTWRPFDSFFRLITARRNPNLVLLTVAALAGAPAAGVVAVAVWTALSLVVHAVQVLQGLAAQRQGPLTSWLRR